MVILKIVFNYILDKTTLAFLGQPTVGKHILHLSALPTETQRKNHLPYTFTSRNALSFTLITTLNPYLNDMLSFQSLMEGLQTIFCTLIYNTGK